MTFSRNFYFIRLQFYVTVQVFSSENSCRENHEIKSRESTPFRSLDYKETIRKSERKLSIFRYIMNLTLRNWILIPLVAQAVKENKQNFMLCFARDLYHFYFHCYIKRATWPK